MSISTERGENPPSTDRGITDSYTAPLKIVSLWTQRTHQSHHRKAHKEENMGNATLKKKKSRDKRNSEKHLSTKADGKTTSIVHSFMSFANCFFSFHDLMREKAK